MGEGSTISTDSHHTLTFIQPSTQPQKTQKPRKPKRKDTQVPDPSDPIESVIDEAVHKELGGSLVRAAEIYGYSKNHKKTFKVGQTQTQERKECSKARDLIARKDKS
ncbi:hypothetical protein Tco_1364176 [Tanacetum coccineum]